MPADKPSSHVQSLARGLGILCLLVHSERAMRITEIGQPIDVDKSTAYRLVVTLVSRGFVRQGTETQLYEPGLEIVNLSRRVLE